MNHLLHNSNITYEFKEVDGHADDSEHFVYDDAPQQIKRNIDMEKRAKQYLTSIRPNPSMFPQQKIALKLAGILITGDLQYQIQQHRYGHALEARLLKSLSAPMSSLKTIAWEGLESAFNKLNTHDK